MSIISGLRTAVRIHISPCVICGLEAAIRHHLRLRSNPRDSRFSRGHRGRRGAQAPVVPCPGRILAGRFGRKPDPPVGGLGDRDGAVASVCAQGQLRAIVTAKQRVLAASETTPSTSTTVRPSAPVDSPTSVRPVARPPDLVSAALVLHERDRWVSPPRAPPEREDHRRRPPSCSATPRPGARAARQQRPTALRAIARSPRSASAAAVGHYFRDAVAPRPQRRFDAQDHGSGQPAPMALAWFPPSAPPAAKAAGARHVLTDPPRVTYDAAAHAGSRTYRAQTAREGSRAPGSRGALCGA